MVKKSDWFEPFKAGEERGIQELFELYYRPMCYRAFKILHDKQEAEGIVGEIFEKAWDKRAKFNTERHLINFLYLVTENTCFKKLRDDKVIEKNYEEWIQQALDETTTETALEYERTLTEMMNIVIKELETLPGGDVIRMSFLEGMSTKEIALALNISENNVYIKKSRGLKVLRARSDLRELWYIVGICLALGIPTDELLQQAYLSSMEKNAIDLTGVPAVFLQPSGQAADRHHGDRSLADAFPLATDKRVR